MVGRIVFVLWIFLSPWLWNTLRRPVLISSYPIWRLDETEIDQINYYRDTYKGNYWSETLGKISLNKAEKVWGHLGSNFFTYLDLNYYFFANHPRERVGVVEIQRLYFWSLPIFLIGLWSLVKKNLFRIWFGSFLGLVGLISLFGLQGVWVEILLLPMMAVVLTLGATYVFKRR